MIDRLLLRNWRGYQKLSLDIGPGLTFVIADNGVGKTSLVNGVAWAMFGDASGIDGDLAIRAGTEETTVEVDLTIGETAFSVVRSLRRTGRRRHSVRLGVDGNEATPNEWQQRMSRAGAVPFDILPPLMLVPEMRLTHEGELFADVQGHLAGLLGIDHLRRSAAAARDVQAGTAREIRDARALARVDDDAVDAARARCDAITAEVEQVDASLAENRQRRRGSDGLLRDLAAWTRYDDDLADYRVRLDRLGAEAQGLGLSAELGADREPVDEAESESRRRADDLTAELATTQAEGDLVRGLIEQLESADAVCPVCLQPVDGEVARHASEAHRSRLAEIERLQAEVERRRRAVDAAAQRIGALASALARLHPPTQPDGERPDDGVEEVEALVAELDAAIADQLGRRGALGEQLVQARRAYEEATRSRAAATDLTRLHTLAAAAGSLAELASREADARTERSLDPLSQTLARRWAEFFVGTSSRPRLAGGGSIELGHAAAAIPYGSFSGGEKTLASLLTRLLFVTSATRLDAMWLDEPLEHLDPANRTKVARLLAQVTQGDSHLRQVLVTTYEEGLARSMIERHDAASILYVSTDDLL
ncbi:MAG: AAA family ATPase [Acidimicrobiales bacterium]